MTLSVTTATSATASKPVIRQMIARQIRRWIATMENYVQPTVVIQWPDAPMYRWSVLLASSVIRQTEYARHLLSARMTGTAIMDSSVTDQRPVKLALA
jgi:hypothetical protein